MKDLYAVLPSELHRIPVRRADKSFAFYLAEAVNRHGPTRCSEPSQHSIATARVATELLAQVLESRKK